MDELSQMRLSKFKVKTLQNCNVVLLPVIMLSESKRNDKFLIRFTPVPQPEDTDLDFAGLFEVASSAFLQQKKIPCSFPSGMVGLMAATGMSASGAAISPIAPSISQTRLNSATGPASETASVVSVSRTGTADLATELKEANRKIEKLTKELKVIVSISIVVLICFSWLLLLVRPRFQRNGQICLKDNTEHRQF